MPTTAEMAERYIAQAEADMDRYWRTGDPFAVWLAAQRAARAGRRAHDVLRTTDDPTLCQEIADRTNTLIDAVRNHHPTVTA